MNKTFIKITLLFTSSLTIMAGATIAPSLPQIQLVFEANPQSLILTKLILTIPGLFIAICAPIVGAIIDRFGRLKILLGSLILYGFAGTSGFFMNDLYSILIGRAFLGMGVAGVMTATITLIADYFEGTERNAFMGVQGAFIALGGVVFITSGGLLAEISWRGPFLIYCSAFVIFPAALVYLYEPEFKTVKKKYISARDPQYPRTLMIVIFVTAFIGMMLFYIIPVQIPFYIKEQTGASNILIGVAIAASTLSSALISINYKRIKARLSFSAIYAMTFFFLGIGFILIYFATDYLSIMFGLLIGGIGMGLMMPNSNVWVVTLSPESMRGRMVGRLTTSVFIGQFISPIIIEPILVLTSSSGLYAVAGVGMLFVSLTYTIYSMINKKYPALKRAILK